MSELANRMANVSYGLLSSGRLLHTLPLGTLPLDTLPLEAKRGNFFKKRGTGL